ncbi:hypothetical protein HJA_04021 [Hyphomonas jannaschiana VP2]|uniref:Uncharacterized protein n=1 Tax=Hyphomonas jannaschiana VP2 TaxID=1280952 RepID=A0A059FI89_9PROT|nr:hypothetical protein HJA_04021 [Hyphomonas jannaschiana VP2]
MTARGNIRVWTPSRFLGVGLALATMFVFLIANAHLVYVAVASQTGCAFTHSSGNADSYRAAAPAC